MQKEVLLIEEAEGWQREFRIMLEEIGFTVRIAETEEAAVSLWNQGTASLAIVDINFVHGILDDYGGLEVINAAKVRIPIICVSGYASREDISATLKEKHDWVDAFFSKLQLDRQKEEFMQKARELAGISETVSGTKPVGESRPSDNKTKLAFHSLINGVLLSVILTVIFAFGSSALISSSICLQHRNNAQANADFLFLLGLATIAFTAECGIGVVFLLRRLKTHYKERYF